MKPVGLTAPYDLGHTHPSFVTEYAGGKMNGFDLVGSSCVGVGVCQPAGIRAYGYVPRGDAEPYFAMAQAYTFGDRTFQTNQGPSFPAHQYILSGTSTVGDGSSLRASENPVTVQGAPTGGCDAPPGSLVGLIDASGSEGYDVYPCFDRISLIELLEAKSLSWRYYQSYIGPGLWNAPDAILRIRRSPAYATNVVAPPATVLADIKDGRLADVVWVTPTALASDHAQATDGSGPSWVADVVNAVGESPYWKDTAIFLTWDDWGGWYDHVKPPAYNSYELGFRVPLIVVSPYAKKHYVSHVQHEFGSILKFTERVFGLGSLHATDERADDLSDCFDFSGPPSAFRPIPTRYPPEYFLKQPPAREDPDDDTGGGYALLYSFGQSGRMDDGRTPVASLVASGGTLYGTTEYGGESSACAGGCGTTFGLSPSGAVRVLHRFAGGSAGAFPAAAMTAFGGALYGTTSGGGNAACTRGCGTIFRSDPEGRTTVAYRFGGSPDGGDPVAALVAVNGALYGTTTYGGNVTQACPAGCGTVFRYDPGRNAESVIYRFKAGSDGALPAGSLVAVDGELYGTTQYGGSRTAFCETGCGTVFRLRVDGTHESVVHRFRYAPGSADGAYPAAGVVAAGGVLYGTTPGGGTEGAGTVFAARASSGSERVLYSFACCGKNDAKRPLSRLIDVDGTFYGTTQNGGEHYRGAVFRVTPAGTESVLYSFAGDPDGASPQAALASIAGDLYGATASGGSAGEGSLFKLSP